MSINWVADIQAMDKKFGFDKDAPRTGNFLRFRQKFLEEELIELDEAIQANDANKVVDSLVDLCVVAIGTLTLFDVSAYNAWNEVHRANMLKERGRNESRQLSLGLDLVKPSGWLPPDHCDNVGSLPVALFQIQDDLKKVVESDQEESVLNIIPSNIPYHIRILQCEIIPFALKKYKDYQSSSSGVKQAEYYPRGIDDILYEVYKKSLRTTSILAILKNDGDVPSFESVEENFRDQIIYLLIGMAWLRGKVDGQDKDADIFNQKQEETV